MQVVPAMSVMPLQQFDALPPEGMLFGTQQLPPATLHDVLLALVHAVTPAHCVSFVHPHAPPLQTGAGVHAAAQLVQTPPSVPHASSARPVAHVVPLQQPPLHTVSFAPPHAVPHLRADVSHAWPAVPASSLSAGQSVATAQPQAGGVPTHAVPFALAAHTAHRPWLPQAPALVPATHDPLLQHPPLHAAEALHLVVQV
jgi:hypothetical protein